MQQLRALAVIVFALVLGERAGVASAQSVGSLLPAGYLTTSGNQIRDLAGHNVRLACVGYFQQGASIAADVRGMAALGFNCLRFPYYDATLAANLATADTIVAAAKSVGLKVIIDHHGDEVPGPRNGYLPYPCNGLPFDSGPGTNGTDGCGDAGTVTEARYVSDWATVARHYAGNPTVIGFDLTNEPHLFPSYWAQNPGGATWGTGGATDLRGIYAQAGDAIEAADPGALVIAEGIINYTSTLLDGKPVVVAGYPDLSSIGRLPLVLTNSRQIVYSVHDYPTPISGVSPDSGATKIQAMNAGWGYLVASKLAPVWVGEMGASLDGVGADSVGSKLGDETACGYLMLSYLNGGNGSQGGPTFSGCDQGVGTDWWAWGNLQGDSPDGTLDDTGQPRSSQHYATQHLAFVRKAGC